MDTPTTSTHPTTQLDLVRGDAAARQRRAATYRFVHEQRGSRGTSRRPLVTALAAMALALGIVTGAAAAIVDEPLPQGYEPGHPDGWFDPNGAEGTFGTAETSIGPAPAPLPHGYEPGNPDGWYVPGSGGVKAAGGVTSSSYLVPSNVR